MAEALFNTQELRDFINTQAQALATEIHSLKENEVLNTSHEDMTKYLTEKWTIDTLELMKEEGQMQSNDANIAIGQDPFLIPSYTGKPLYIAGTCITIYLPFTGNPELLKCRPRMRNTNPPKANIRDSELVFTYHLTDPNDSSIERDIEEDINQTVIHVEGINSEIEKFNAILHEEVSNKLRSRRNKLLADKKLAESIGFPLRRSEDLPKAVLVPHIRKRIETQRPKPSGRTFDPEPTLDMDHYAYILSILSNMVTVMERSPRAFKNMGEEDLRAHFLVQLNGHFEGQATGETFNYEGKTDILIRDKGKNIFIAECKFWIGPAGLTNALDQLLSYTAWRDTKAALLVFNRDRSMSTVLERVPETVREHANYKTQRTSASDTEFRYIFGHKVDKNREITITILVFDVPA